MDSSSPLSAEAVLFYGALKKEMPLLPLPAHQDPFLCVEAVEAVKDSDHEEIRLLSGGQCEGSANGEVGSARAVRMASREAPRVSQRQQLDVWHRRRPSLPKCHAEGVGAAANLNSPGASWLTRRRLSKRQRQPLHSAS